MLAPLALIVCAFAVFTVLTSGGSNTATNGSSQSTKSGAKGASGSGSKNGGNASSGAGTSTPTRATYRVKPGDSFAAISQKTGVGVDKLSQLNPGIDPRALQPGQKLKLK